MADKTNAQLKEELKAKAEAEKLQAEELAKARAEIEALKAEAKTKEEEMAEAEELAKVKKAEQAKELEKSIAEPFKNPFPADVERITVTVGNEEQIKNKETIRAGINGYPYSIEAGKAVKIPREVVQLLQNAGYLVNQKF